MDTKALRQKILDLAIRGKLVPQDPNDEPASVLLERIRAEKQQMVKDGKLKPKDIKNDTVIFKADDNLHYEKFADGSVKCIEDEIPFELPEGWAWSRLASICLKITDGTHHSPDNFPAGEYKYVTAKNIKPNGIVLDDITYVTAEVHKEIFARCNPEFGDILYIKDGATSGVATVNTLHEEFSMLSSVALLKPSSGIDNWYMCYVMQSPYFYNTTRGDMKGVGITRITLNMLTSRLIPLPPQNEQQQISVNTSKLIKLIVSIQKNKDDVLKLVSIAKSKILDLAIRGKLVPQDPNDEPASVLLERIRAEKEELIKQGKIKRDKKESVIFKGDDNSYYATIEGTPVAIAEHVGFELPSGWTWISLRDVAFITSGKTPKNNQLSASGKVPYFKVADMNTHGNEMYLQYSDNYINDLYSGPIFEKGSFVFPKNGGAVLTNKKRILFQASVVDLNTGVFTPSRFIDPEFAFYLFMSIDFSKIYKGAVIPTVDSSVIGNLIFGMPPLEEQRRIASKIKMMFTQLEKVENILS